GAKWVKVPLDSSMRTDLAALSRAITPATRAVYICHPNNPTGTTLPPEAVRDACLEMSKRTLVVVDEAYADYLPPAQRADLASLVRTGENVCLLRTFSKIHALAGMRVGYAMGRKELLAKMRRSEWGTQMTNQAGLVGAFTSLDDTANILENRRRNVAVMASTQSMLTGLGFSPIPSVANHIWFALRRPAGKFREDLANAGYAVVASSEKDGEWCRLTLGTPEQMTGFEKALRALV
ncbi:MAG: aminotransferase class I/II-fold pyridoxal phosphate-dependent enzyme, partial [Gemmatimonadaceae bacterium]